MKSLLIFFSFSLSFVVSASQKQDLCLHRTSLTVNGSKYEGKVLAKPGSWLVLAPPEDSFRLTLNEQVLLDFVRPGHFVGHQTFTIPLPTPSNAEVHLQLETKDLNGHHTSPPVACVHISDYSDAQWRAAWIWFKKNGVIFGSMFTLFVISFFASISLFFRKDAAARHITIYAIFASLYLFSFSEHPRALFDPELASGGIHFCLRLLQDLLLVRVFAVFYSNEEGGQKVRGLLQAYYAVIACFVSLILAGVRSYSTYHQLIVVTAPLVAAPMAVATWFSWKSSNRTERIFLIPLSAILLLCQINDLMNFWGLVNTYYTVKFYIPFIMGQLLVLSHYRGHRRALELNRLEVRDKTLKSFYHDVRSPLATLRIALQGVQQNIKPQQFLTSKSALESIERMVAGLSHVETLSGNTFTCPVASVLNDVISVKKVEHPHAQIIFESPLIPCFGYANPDKLWRIISNVINNGIESYKQGELPLVSVSVKAGFPYSIIAIDDEGRGIPKELATAIGHKEFSTKHKLRGAGLFFAAQELAVHGGRLEALAREHKGTSIRIYILTAPAPFWYSDISPPAGDSYIILSPGQSLGPFLESPAPLLLGVDKLPIGTQCLSQLEKSALKIFLNRESARPTSQVILVDDDKYLANAWSKHFLTRGIPFTAYATATDLTRHLYMINKSAIFFLDYHLCEANIDTVINDLTKEGYTNLYISTGSADIPDTIAIKVRGVIGKAPPEDALILQAL